MEMGREQNICKKQRVEGLSKKGKGLTDMDNSVMIAGGRGIREQNSNGKNTIQINLKEKKHLVKQKKALKISLLS